MDLSLILPIASKHIDIYTPLFYKKNTLGYLHGEAKAKNFPTDNILVNFFQKNFSLYLHKST